MAKRRAVPRFTMTLRDFHGGSIPSDLPLPSAPGKTVERGSYERQSSGAWMIPPAGRGYTLDRSGIHRPGSATGIRSFEDKASYFPNAANIGRNYDEDERKPVDGRSRGNHSVEPFDLHDYDERKSAYIGEEKGGFKNHTMFSGQSVSGYDNASYVHEPSMAVLSKPYVADSGLQSNVRQNNHSVPHSPEVAFYGQPRPQSALWPSSGRHSGYPQPPASPQEQLSSNNQQQQATVKLRGASGSLTVNVWTARREYEHSRGTSAESDAPRPPSPWMPLKNMARVAEASAIEKVSSGRWQPDYSRVPSTSVVDNGTSAPTIRGRPISPHSHYVPDDSSSGYRAPAPPDTLSGQQAAGYRSDRGIAIDPERLIGSIDDASRHYLDNSEKLSSAGRGGSYPDLSRISLNERGQGSYTNQSAERSLPLEDIYLNHSESDRHVYSSDAMLSEAVPSRTAGFSKGGSGGYHGADDILYRGAYQAQDGREYRRESMQRSFNSDAEVDKGSSRGYGVSASQGKALTGREGPQGHIDDVVQKAHDLLAPTHDLFSESSLSARAKNQYASKDSVEQNLLERTGRVDSLKPNQKVFLSERSSSNPSLEDSYGSSYLEGRRGRYSSDSGQSSFSPERELKRSFSGSDDRFSFSADGPAAAVSESAPLSAVIPDQSRLGPDERPRLKLLPRSKPLEQASENTCNGTGESTLQEGSFTDAQLDGRKNLAGLKTSGSLVIRSTQDNGVKSTATSPSIEIDEQANKTIDRPKLNLKPRSRPVENEVESGTKDRSSVFGGARPRELVLKERGVEDPLVLGANNTWSRVKQDQIEHQNVLQVGSQDKWLASDEKQGSRQADRQSDRSLNRKYLERQDSDRLERHENGNDQRESKWSSGRNVDPGHSDQQINRRDQVRRIPDKQDVTRDIDKQESWRRSSDQSVSATLQNHLKDNSITYGEKHSIGYGVKYGSYGIASADPKRLAALTQSKLAFVPHGLDHYPDYESHPGKRAPLRSQESHYS